MVLVQQRRLLGRMQKAVHQIRAQKMKKKIIQTIVCLLLSAYAAEAAKLPEIELDIASGKHGRIVQQKGRTFRIGKRGYRMLNVSVPANAGKFYIFLELKENGSPQVGLTVRKGKKVLQKFQFPAARQWQWVRLGPLEAKNLSPDFDICAGSDPGCQLYLARAVISSDPQWKSSSGTKEKFNLPGIAVGRGGKGIQAGPFLLVGEKHFAKDQTSVSFHWDDKALYAEFTGFDRSLDPRANRLHEFKSKEKNPWRNDYMILLLKRGKVMYDFLVTGGGVLDDGRMRGPDYWGQRDPAWRSGAVVSAKIGNGVWHARLAVPWQAVGGKPAAGEVFQFQAGRKTRSSNETSAIFPTKTGFHDPESFGLMYFRNKTLPAVGIRLPEFLPGGNQIPLPSGINSEIHVAFPDKFPEFYRGNSFQLNNTGRFSFQWNFSDPATGLPCFVSPRYTLAVSACRLEFSSGQSIGLNGAQVKTGALLKSGLNRIVLPGNFKGKVSAGGVQITPPAGTFTLAVESSLLWPNWHEKEVAVPAGGLQMLMFAPRGFPGKLIRDYTIKLDLPPGFKVECASGYYNNYKIKWSEDGLIRFQTPLKYSDLPPTHRFISVFIRAPQTIPASTAEIAYASSSASEKIVEIPRKFKIRVLPPFRGIRPKHFRIIAWSGFYRRLTDNAYLQTLVKEIAKYGINEAHGIPGKHLSYSTNFNLFYYSWTSVPYIKKYPERALIRKNGKADPTLVCPQYIRTPEYARWVNEQMPGWLAKIGNPPVAEWDYEYRYDSGPFSCYCKKCIKESDVASRNRMTAYYARLLRDAMKRCDPKIKFVMYSGYQSEETKSHYGIDWSLLRGIVDMVECGYGRSEKTLAATRKAIGDTPLVTGVIIRPYLVSSRAFPEPYTRARLLRRAADATGGILLYEYSLFDGRSLEAIAEVSRIISRYEDHFRFGRRKPYTVPGWNGDDVQVIEHRGKSLLLLMNQSKMPKKFNSRTIVPGGIAAEILP